MFKVFIAFVAFALAATGDVPQIDVLVESLCPDCMEFIAGPFKDFMNYNVPNLAVVNFIPFGNANEEYDEEKKKWIFSCQHQENECNGNLIETCAINLLGRVESYKVIVCIEENIKRLDRDFNKTLEACVDKDTRDKIMDCFNSDLGNKYQHEMAQKTPEHKYVPWIITDGVHDIDAENRMLENMIEYLCSISPDKCISQRRSNFLQLHSKKRNYKKCFNNRFYKGLK